MSGAIIALIVLSFQANEMKAEQLALLKTFRSEFVQITPGKDRFPKHETLREYSIAKYELPQNLWQSVMGSNPSRWKGPRNSVERMSFTEAKRFCTKATELMRVAKLISGNEEVRLPYEDEWEYAVRAGTKTAYSFGDDVAKLDEYAWSTQNAAGNDPAVGVLKPNPWGLYDVHGYLWEFCLSRRSSEKKKDKSESPRSEVVVIRGGSWKDKAEMLRTSFRQLVKQTDRDDALGLRCVLATVAAPESSTASNSDSAK